MQHQAGEAGMQKAYLGRLGAGVEAGAGAGGAAGCAES